MFNNTLLELAADEVLQLALPTSAASVEAAQYFRGRCQLVDKDYYAARPVVTQLGFGSALARQLWGELRQSVAAFFLQRKTRSYQLAPHELVAALDKLLLDDRHLIIGVLSENGINSTLRPGKGA